MKLETFLSASHTGARISLNLKLGYEILSLSDVTLSSSSSVLWPFKLFRVTGPCISSCRSDPLYLVNGIGATRSTKASQCDGGVGCSSTHSNESKHLFFPGRTCTCHTLHLRLRQRLWCPVSILTSIKGIQMLKLGLHDIPPNTVPFV